MKGHKMMLLLGSFIGQASTLESKRGKNAFFLIDVSINNLLYLDLEKIHIDIQSCLGMTKVFADCNKQYQWSCSIIR